MGVTSRAEIINSRDVGGAPNLNFHNFRVCFNYHSMRLSILLLLIAISAAAVGQGQTLADVIDPNFQNSDIKNKKKDIDGTPYLFTEYRKGEVWLTSGKQLKELMIRYDLYNKLLEIKTQEAESGFNMKLVESFVLTDNEGRSLVFKKYNGLFQEVVAEGNGAQIYFRYLKKIVPGQQGNGYTETTKDRLETSVQGLFVKDAAVIEFNNAKSLAKKLADEFPDQEARLNAVVKSGAFKQAEERGRLSLLIEAMGA